MGPCVLCGQQITNPLCPERLAEQMESWLGESKPELIQALKAKTEDLLLPCNGDTKCIVTGRNMDLCTYCYTEHIFNWLRSIKAPSAMLRQYMTFFNYDEGRLGYWKEAEALKLTP